MIAMKNRTGAALLLLSFLLAGCAGTLSVKKVKDHKTKGLRYHLPQPYLVVWSDKTGLHTKTVILPDESEEYAIRSKTFLTKHKFGISLDRGMLKEIQYYKDSTKLAKALIEQGIGGGTEVGLAERVIGNRVTEKANRAKATAAAMTNVRTARVALQKAQSAEKATAHLPADNAVRLAAEQKTRDAQIDLNAAIEVLDLTERGEIISGASKAAPKPDRKITYTWGPVWYRVVDTGTNVMLEPVKFTNGFSQDAFATSHIPAEKKSGASKPVDKDKVDLQLLGGVKRVGNSLEMVVGAKQQGVIFTDEPSVKAVQDKEGNEVAVTKATAKLVEGNKGRILVTLEPVPLKGEGYTVNLIVHLETKAVKPFKFDSPGPDAAPSGSGDDG